jgi:hypothetical protein
MNKMTKEEYMSQQVYLSKKEKEDKLKIKGYIYIIKSDFGYKIGKSKDAKNRVKNIGLQLPFKIELIFQFYVEGYHMKEKQLHEQFKNKHINGEWFNLSDEDIEAIKNICV